MRKHAVRSSILTLIGSILFLIIAALFFTAGMISPLTLTINDYQVRAYLWEFAKYPGPLSLWLSFIFVFVLLALIGIVFSRKVKKRATTSQGVILIIIGIFSLFLGAGIFYLIGGIQALLARGNDQDISSSQM